MSSEARKTCCPWFGSGDPVRLRITLTKAETVPGARRVGDDGATVWRECAFEEHRLDPVVVVEVFDVAEVGDRSRYVGMKVRGAVPGELPMMRLGQGGDLPPHGVSAAPVTSA